MTDETMGRAFTLIQDLADAAVRCGSARKPAFRKTYHDEYQRLKASLIQEVRRLVEAHEVDEPPAAVQAGDVREGLAEYLMDCGYVAWAGKNWKETTDEHYRDIFRKRADAIINLLRAQPPALKALVEALKIALAQWNDHYSQGEGDEFLESAYHGEGLMYQKCMAALTPFLDSAQPKTPEER